MNQGYGVRDHQRPKVQRLQSLINEVTQLRVKGMNDKADALLLEIRKLEKELGFKTRWRETKAERAAGVKEFKKRLMERLKKK